MADLFSVTDAFRFHYYGLSPKPMFCILYKFSVALLQSSELCINTYRAFKILRKERPDAIITSGAAPAIPFFWIGKLMGAKTVYIEVFDRIDKSTVSGRLCYPVTDKFIVEWEEMKSVYKKAINLGSIF